MTFQIFSPTYGTVENAWLDAKDRLHVRIYIAPSDKHTIHAPADGILVAVEAEAMNAVRTGFQAVEHKRGRLRFRFNTGVEALIEVGEGYITDLIALAPTVKDLPMRVTAGQRLGTIVIGSRSELIVPGTWIPHVMFSVDSYSHVSPHP